MVKINSQTTGDLEDSGIAVKLSEDDAPHSRVGNRLEARPARGGRYIQVRTVDGHAIFCGMNDRVLLRMNRGNTVVGFKHVSDFIAVRHASD